MQRSQTIAPDREVLEKALHRLRLNFYHLYRPIKDLHDSSNPKAVLRQWRRAEKPSQGWRNLQFYAQAIGVLTAAMGVPRDEAAALVREYINEHLQT